MSLRIIDEQNEVGLVWISVKIGFVGLDHVRVHAVAPGKETDTADSACRVKWMKALRAAAGGMRWNRRLKKDAEMIEVTMKNLNALFLFTTEWF